MGLEELHHRAHARAVGDAAGHAIGKYLMDIETGKARILTASRFLGAQARAAHPGFLLADATIDDRRLCF